MRVIDALASADHSSSSFDSSLSKSVGSLARTANILSIVATFFSLSPDSMFADGKCLAPEFHREIMGLLCLLLLICM